MSRKPTTHLATPEDTEEVSEAPVVEAPPVEAPTKRGFGIVSIQIDLDTPGLPMTPNISQNMQPNEIVNTFLQMTLHAHAAMIAQPIQQENEALKKEIEELRKHVPSPALEE